MRPAAAEWDEREETPGRSSRRPPRSASTRSSSSPTRCADPTGLRCPVASEELFWGDAGIGLAIFGTALAAAGIAGNGTPEQIGRVGAAVLRHADDVQLAAFCVTEPDAGSDVVVDAHPRRLRRGHRRVGAQRQKAWVTNGGIANVHVVVAARRPRARVAGQAAFVVPPGTPGLRQGQKFKKHGIRASHTAEVVLDDVRVPGRCLLGGKEKLDARWPGPARAGTPAQEQAGDAHVRGDPADVGAQALGIARAAYEYALDYAKEREAVRPADHREPGASRSSSPTCAWRSTPPGCWCGGPPGWAATAGRSRTARAR